MTMKKDAIANGIEKGKGTYDKIANTIPNETPIHNKCCERYSWPLIIVFFFIKYKKRITEYNNIASTSMDWQQQDVSNMGAI